MKIERENTRFKLATKLIKNSATCSNTFKPQCATATVAAAAAVVATTAWLDGPGRILQTIVICLKPHTFSHLQLFWPYNNKIMFKDDDHIVVINK